MAYTYARRIELRAQAGWTDPAGKYANAYTYYRAVQHYLSNNALWIEEVAGTEADTPTNQRAFFDAFKRADPDDYTVARFKGQAGWNPVSHKGAKAFVLVKVLKYVPSFAEFKRMYPTGTRFGHLLEEPAGVRERRGQGRMTKRRRLRR